VFEVAKKVVAEKVVAEKVVDTVKNAAKENHVETRVSARKRNVM
jgi:hypothetical protein